MYPVLNTKTGCISYEIDIGTSYTILLHDTEDLSKFKIGRPPTLGWEADDRWVNEWVVGFMYSHPGNTVPG